MLDGSTPPFLSASSRLSNSNSNSNIHPCMACTAVKVGPATSTGAPVTTSCRSESVVWTKQIMENAYAFVRSSFLCSASCLLRSAAETKLLSACAAGMQSCGRARPRPAVSTAARNAPWSACMGRPWCLLSPFCPRNHSASGRSYQFFLHVINGMRLTSVDNEIECSQTQVISGDLMDGRRRMIHHLASSV